MGLNVGKNLVNQAQMSLRAQNAKPAPKAGENEAKPSEIQDKSGTVKANALDVLANQNRGTLLINRNEIDKEKPMEPIDVEGCRVRVGDGPKLPSMIDDKTAKCEMESSLMTDEEIAIMYIKEHKDEILELLSDEDKTQLTKLYKSLLTGLTLNEEEMDNYKEIYFNILNKIQSYLVKEGVIPEPKEDDSIAYAPEGGRYSWWAYFAKYNGINMNPNKSTLDRFFDLSLAPDLDIGSNGYLDLLIAGFKATRDYRNNAEL